MRPYESVFPLSVTPESAASLDVDVLVVAVADGEVLGGAAELDRATGGRLAAAIQSKEMPAKAFSTFVTAAGAAGWTPRRVLAVSVGRLAACDVNQIRRWAAAATLVCRDRRWPEAAFVLPGVLDGPIEARAVAEGITLGGFDTGAYKNAADARLPGVRGTIVVPPETGPLALDELERATSRGFILGSCSNLARALANEPSNRLPPRAFAELAEEVAATVGLKVDVLDEERLAGLGMGMLLAVARGSSEPPRLVVLRYEPARPATRSVLGLVGKGVTFDTGGISIKSADGMHRMKTDMSGGAAVLAAMKAVAVLKPDVSVIGVIPLAENMPDGRAMRPGDVLRSAAGHTVEVLDTDAEGRLLLGDALWYAGYLGATHLVDVATLTGACVVALGRSTSGLFGSHDDWTRLVHGVTARTGDRSWVMPLFEDYKDQLRSEIADMANIGGRAAGAVTAAVFLKEFTAGLPWVHLDIAGTAWADDAQPFQPKGPTGVAVRTLAELALSSEEWAAPLE